MVDFSKINTVHFIGVGGIGTSAIARMFLLEGKKVSGSDMAESEVTQELRKVGVRIYLEEDARNVPTECDLVIYTIAIPKDHAELTEAKKRGIPILSYPEALGIISKDKNTIAITGTHGKTTTTAMVAKILMDAGLDPTVIVGSLLLDVARGSSRSDLKSGERSDLKGTTRTNFVAGKSKYLVVEGCEYRRSFLNLFPEILVITNIDDDNLDYYKDLTDIKSAFAELAAKLPHDGVLIDEGKYGGISLSDGFTLRIPGKHNISNAKAALAVARALKIPDATALNSLADFSGTWRRFEYRGKAPNGALVYDDYGHHPTEIEATLQGARELFTIDKGGGSGYSPLGSPDSGGLSPKIVVVFQPHLYSRTKQHLEGFALAFKEASSVVLLPIYPAREKDPGDTNSQMVVDVIKKQGKDAHLVQTFGEAVSLAQNLCGAGDIIITLGAGETNKVADLLVHKGESS